MRKWYKIWAFEFHYPHDQLFLANPLFSIWISLGAPQINRCVYWWGVFVTWWPRDVPEGEYVHKFRREWTWREIEPGMRF